MSGIKKPQTFASLVRDKKLVQVDDLRKEAAPPPADKPLRPNCRVCVHATRIIAERGAYTCRHPSAMAHGTVLGDQIKKTGACRYGIFALNAGRAGIKRGDFNWPARFQTVWVLACTGFQQKGRLIK